MAIGFKDLVVQHRGTAAERRPRTTSSLASIALITLSNGADNIGICVPFFVVARSYLWLILIAPIAHEGFFATHFFTVSDQDKSTDFYVRILGGKVINPDNPCYIKLANTWIILNSGGGPTPDKPEVLLEKPSDLNKVNSFLNLRVADIWACYKQWGDKRAFFLTEPRDNHGWEWRCYMRDPDGYLIEVGQYTQIALDRFKNAS